MNDSTAEKTPPKDGGRERSERVVDGSVRAHRTGTKEEHYVILLVFYSIYPTFYSPSGKYIFYLPSGLSGAISSASSGFSGQ